MMWLPPWQMSSTIRMRTVPSGGAPVAASACAPSRPRSDSRAGAAGGRAALRKERAAAAAACPGGGWRRSTRSTCRTQPERQRVGCKVSQHPAGLGGGRPAEEAPLPTGISAASSPATGRSAALVSPGDEDGLGILGRVILLGAEENKLPAAHTDAAGEGTPLGLLRRRPRAAGTRRVIPRQVQKADEQQLLAPKGGGAKRPPPALRR
eukprot:scaffold9376_cov85-Isochrysis_galbana.AAC.1